MSLLSILPLEGCLALKQPTSMSGVKPTFRQLKSFLIDNLAQLSSVLPSAPRLSYLSELQ